jgi:hypothetical protein
VLADLRLSARARPGPNFAEAAGCPPKVSFANRVLKIPEAHRFVEGFLKHFPAFFKEMLGVSGTPWSDSRFAFNY